jgi:tetratricopeptide (TPR) repeat protein
MDTSSEKEKINIDARMHAAETFYSMGLLTEAIDAYNEIIQDIPDLDENKKMRINEKIKSIQKELGEMDHKEVADLTDKELNLIKKTFTSDGHGNISQLLNSGYALRELGLYEEALNEYKKLFSLEYPKIKILIEILECMLKIQTHAEVIQKSQEMMDTCGIKGTEKNQMNNMLSVEMDKRGYKKVAHDLLKLADPENQDGGILQERRTALDGISSETIDPKTTKEKSNHLLVEKTQKPEPFSNPVTGSKYDYLIKEKLVNLEQLQSALALSKKQKKSVEHILIEKFKIQKEEVGKSLSEYSSCKFKSFDPDFPVPYELIGNLKKSFLLNEVWIPLKWDKNSVEILVDDPKNLIKTDRIRALVKAKKLIFSVGTKEDIEAYINHFFENKKREDSATSMVFNDSFDLIPDIEFEEERDLQHRKIWLMNLPAR